VTVCDGNSGGVGSVFVESGDGAQIIERSRR
jgi:hypothetical protein